MKNLYLTLFCILPYWNLGAQGVSSMEDSSPSNLSSQDIQETNSLPASIYSITDQLGVAKSSKSIYKGTLLTNVNYTYSELFASDTYHYFGSIANGINVNAGYGITKWLDVRIGFNRNSIYTSHYADEHRNDIQKVLSLGTKANIVSQKKWMPELAFFAEYVYATFPSDYVGLAVAWSYRFGSKLRFGGDVGSHLVVSKLGSDVGSPVHYSLNVRYEIRSGLGVFLDVASSRRVNIRHYNAHCISPNLGAYYELNSNVQFHIKYGQVLDTENGSYSSKAYSFEGGFSWLLLNN